MMFVEMRNTQDGDENNVHNMKKNKVFFALHSVYITDWLMHQRSQEQYVIFCIGDVYFIFFNVFYLVYLSYHCYNSSCIYVTIGSNIAKDIHITQTDIPNRGSIVQNKTVTVSLMYFISVVVCIQIIADTYIVDNDWCIMLPMVTQL